MRNDITFSIVTPTFNSEKTLKRTFDSILNQTYRKFDYIIVDGKSNDGTIKIIEEYLIKFKENGIATKYISEKDEGIADAFNKGVSLATGDLVGIINSDDWLEYNALETIVENYDQQYKIYCGDLKLYENGVLVRQKKSRPSLLWFAMCVMHPTAFVSKEIYSHHQFDKSLKIAMDYDFMRRITKEKQNKILYIPKILAHMEFGGVSSDLTKMKIEELKVIKRYTPKLLYYVLFVGKNIVYFTFENIFGKRSS